MMPAGQGIIKDAKGIQTDEKSLGEAYSGNAERIGMVKGGAGWVMKKRLTIKFKKYKKKASQREK